MAEEQAYFVIYDTRTGKCLPPNGARLVVRRDQLKERVIELMSKEEVGAYAMVWEMYKIQIYLRAQDTVRTATFDVASSGRIFGKTVSGSTREYYGQEDLFAKRPEWKKRAFLAVPETDKQK